MKESEFRAESVESDATPAPDPIPQFRGVPRFTTAPDPLPIQKPRPTGEEEDELHVEPELLDEFELIDPKREQEVPDDLLDLLAPKLEPEADTDAGDSEDRPQPVKKKRRRRRSKGLRAGEDWARVDDFLSEIRKSETDQKSIRVRYKS